MSDGTAYYPPGGGSVSSGDGGTVYLYQVPRRSALEYREAGICRREVELRAKLNLSNEAELELKARFRIDFPDGYEIDVYEPVSKVWGRF